MGGPQINGQFGRVLAESAPLSNQSRICWPGFNPGFFVDGKILHDLWVALALMLVIEGVFPFLSPGAMKNIMKSIAEMDEKSLRISGLFSMVLGVVALYLVN